MIKETFKQLKSKILKYSGNEHLYPPVSDISFIMGDFSSTKHQMKTSMWVLYVGLSKIYDIKMSGREGAVLFEEVWNWAKGDIRIAKLCRSGGQLDLSIFD